MNENENRKPSEEHREHQREEQILHEEHEREEQQLHQAHEQVEAELHKAEERLHQQHVQEEEALHSAHEREEEASEHCGLVKITINDVVKEVERGVYPVAKIKELGNVPQAYNLLQEIDGQLVLLADDASLTIKGCEVFHSRVKSGGSS